MLNKAVVKRNVQSDLIISISFIVHHLLCHFLRHYVHLRTSRYELHRQILYIKHAELDLIDEISCGPINQL